jgi:hypothetical protein
MPAFQPVHCMPSAHQHFEAMLLLTEHSRSCTGSNSPNTIWHVDRLSCVCKGWAVGVSGGFANAVALGAVCHILC